MIDSQPPLIPSWPPPRGPWAMLWHRLRKNRLAMSRPDDPPGALPAQLLSVASSPLYDSNETNKYTVKYGPMLVGGYVIEKTSAR